jgi:hypothetical protein
MVFSEGKTGSNGAEYTPLVRRSELECLQDSRKPQDGIHPVTQTGSVNRWNPLSADSLPSRSVAYAVKR